MDAVAQAELGEDVRETGLDRRLAEEERPGDLAVGEPARCALLHAPDRHPGAPALEQCIGAAAVPGGRVMFYGLLNGRRTAAVLTSAGPALAAATPARMADDRAAEVQDAWCSSARRS
jgi:hypothetical protein